MIDRLPAQAGIYPASNAAASVAPRKILRMVSNDRTAGSMPEWQKVSTAAQEVENDLALAQQGTDGQSAGPENARAYRPTQTKQAEEPFGFGDLIDIVNPLQHLPIISHFYRELTGDTIRPSGEILGGAIYGGIAGVASGFANVILERETGKDMAGNAEALVLHGETPRWRSSSPVEGTNMAAADLPGSLLAFADLKSGAGASIEKTPDYWNPPKRPVWERG